MTGDRWKRVQELFQEAADLSAQDRRAFLNASCGDDASLRREVESLFEYDARDNRLLTGAVRDAAAALVSGETMMGMRLGAYRVVRQLGSGGMGSVYLAHRDDGHFEKSVAIKLVRAGLDTGAVLDRFRYERRILAQLDHRYIAKLLDGGTAADGRPYFVMEYVAGKPIHEYCAERQLTVEQKCELFLNVCEAVSYAHRNLVIHRDLKPSNILVTEEGIPKLLDFGIAKLLTPDAAELTAALTGALANPLTPDYASPEQVRGQALNTTTDVYSLGAVLFQLLTGVKPHRITTYNTQEVERAVCNEEIRKPSSAAGERPPAAGAAHGRLLHRQLKGDLDNIVLMAMRKEPERRYHSAAEFGDDIQRYLKGLPVKARGDAGLYRARKFVRRHRFGALAASLVVIALSAGVISTNIEARRAEQARAAAEAQKGVAEKQRQNAERERELAQREHAEAAAQRDAAFRAQKQAEAKSHEADQQRQRAEQRTRQLLGLANESLFNVHDAIASLPGATEARRKLVQGTLRYLDQLAKESGDDDGLLELLGSGYAAMAMVQGYPYRPNLGDFAGALVSYEKAAGISDRLLARQPGKPALLLAAVNVYQGWGELLNIRGRRAEGLARLQTGLRAAELLVSLQPGDRHALTQIGVMHHSLATLYMNVDVPAASEHALKDLAVFSKLVEGHPEDWESLNALVSSYLIAASAAYRESRLADSIAYLRKAVTIREELVRNAPNDVLLLRNLLVSYGTMGDYLGGPYLGNNMNDRTGALGYYKKALEIAERLYRQDQADRLARSDVATALMRTGITLDRPGEIEESLADLHRSETLAKQSLATDSKDLRSKALLAMDYEFIGHRLEQQGNDQSAIGSYRDSLEIAGALAASDPKNSSYFNQTYSSCKALAALMGRLGRRADALQYADQMIEYAQKFPANDPSNYRLMVYAPRSYEGKAGVFEALARGEKNDAARSREDWNQARAWFTRSRDAWVKLGEIPALRPVGADLDRLAAKLTDCDAAINGSAR